MAHSTLDAVGLKCPKPLFEVHKAIKNLAVGDTLEVTADDPAFKLDIEAWCRRTGHELKTLDPAESGYVAVVEKSK